MEDFDQMRLALQTIGEFFASSLGPKGLDKLIYDAFDNHLIVSNDGSTILKSLEEIITPKLSPFLLKWGKVIAEHEGDGIKTFYILLGSLLGECQALKQQGILIANIIDTVHFIQINWRELKQSLSFDYPSEKIQLEILQQYLKTSLVGRFSTLNGDFLSLLISNFLQLIPSDKIFSESEIKSSIHFQYLPGAFIQDSRVFQGAIISKEPTNLSLYPLEGFYNAKILIIRAKLYYDLPQKGDEQQSIPFEMIYSNPNKIDQTRDFLKEFAIRWGEAIQKTGCDIVITEKGVEDQLEQYFSLQRILLIRRAKIEEIRPLAEYYHIPIIERFEEISEKSIGIVPRVKYEKIGKDRFFLFESSNQVPPNICPDSVLSKDRYHTILVGGSNYYICQEVERYLHKLILRGQDFRVHHRYFIGGGNIELRIGLALQKMADQLPDIRGWILTQLAPCFFRIPNILAQSSGLDPTDLLTLFKSELIHDSTAYFDVNTAQIHHNSDPSFFDSYMGKDFLFSLLFESLLQLLRIDRVIEKRRKVQ